MTDQESPLYPLLNEINQAARGGLPLLAIGMTVALPDICASLVSEDGRTNGEQYRQWCADNLPNDQFGFVTPGDLWSMRCGVLHNGRFGDMKHSVERVIFVPAGSPATMVNCQTDNSYLYSVVDFCQNFTNAVYRWFEDNRENALLQKNLPRLMQYRDGQSYPFNVGFPVLG